MGGFIVSSNFIVCSTIPSNWNSSNLNNLHENWNYDSSKQVTQTDSRGGVGEQKPAGEKAHKACHLFSVVNRCIKQQAFLWERRQTKHCQNTQRSSNRDRMEHSICLLGLTQQPEMRNHRRETLSWRKWVFYFINLCKLNSHDIVFFHSQMRAHTNAQKPDRPPQVTGVFIFFILFFFFKSAAFRGFVLLYVP